MPDAPAPRPGVVRWLRDGIGWRLGVAGRRARAALGLTDQHWCRVVMDRTTAEYVAGLDTARLDCLEISGTKWRTAGFRSYQTASYPDYDVCAGPHRTEGYDVVIAEQVLEHVLWPYRAVKHVYEMLRPGGVFVVTTPFLLRVHAYPVDCSRWTELGLKHLLAEGGFPMDGIRTGGWGNRACVRGNLNRWANWIPWRHSLRNEADFPVVVWAFARKAAHPEPPA